jgi:hypothetical protein
MPLTTQEINKIRKGKKTGKKAVIPKAIKHEDRVRLHSEITLSRADTSQALEEIIRFVYSVLPNDKAQQFEKMLEFPISTVSLSSEIYTVIQKVFDGKNPVTKLTFASENDQNDCYNYLNKIKFFEYFETTGFEMMKTEINSVLIVDLPSEQTTDLPEPYFYKLPLSQVVDFETVDGSQMYWILFNDRDGNLALFDDEKFVIFQKDKDGKPAEMPTFVTFHNLETCPARFFWTSSISQNTPEVKMSVLSGQLGELNKLVFYETSNEDLQLFARFPVYWSFRVDCDFEDPDPKRGHYCDKGFLRAKNGDYLLAAGMPKPCPVCSNSRLNGAGTHVQIDPPGIENDNADLRNPVNIETIDRSSLDYNNEDVEARRNRIFTKVTGFKGLPLNNQAVNEKQVAAIFESMETALNMPQSNFEKIMTWTASIIARLRYSTFESAFISLGTEHYILTPSQLLEMYKQGRESGFNTLVLDLLENRYFDTQYKNNPDQLNRQRVLLHLDPFRHLTLDRLAEMKRAGEIKNVDYLVKVNFSSLIDRFERENGPLHLFGINATFETKINGIKQALETYAAELMPNFEQQ